MADLSPAENLEELLDGARYGDIEAVNEALERGADVNAADEFGRTALHMAAANGHDEVLTLLIAEGADVEQANAEKNTALHWACLNGQLTAVRELLAAGASPTAINAADETPVDGALFRGHQDVVDAINEHVLGKAGAGEVSTSAPSGAVAGALMAGNGVDAAAGGGEAAEVADEFEGAEDAEPADG